MSLLYLGRIEFPHEFIITRDLLGKDYITQIGNVSVVVQMPIAEVSKEGLHVDLKSPYEWFEFDVGWGYVVHTVPKDSFVKAALLMFRGDEECAQNVYAAFPDWLYRFMIFARALSHELTKESVTESLQHGSDGIVDKYTGLLLYKLVDSKKLYERNKDNVIVGHSDESLINNTGISDSEMKEIMKYAGSHQPISKGYFLLSEAFLAYQRGDNISSVILSSIALEDGLVERIKNYREKHNIKLTKTGPLGKKFKLLAEYGINIPVSDYESQIVEFRNNVVHHANKVSDYDARRFWKECQLIMREYDYSMISD